MSEDQQSETSPRTTFVFSCCHISPQRVCFAGSIFVIFTFFNYILFLFVFTPFHHAYWLCQQLCIASGGGGSDSLCMLPMFCMNSVSSSSSKSLPLTGQYTSVVFGTVLVSATRTGTVARFSASPDDVLFLQKKSKKKF